MSLFPVEQPVIETAAVLADTVPTSTHGGCLDYHGKVHTTILIEN
jgi:hypothetical protein